MQGDCLEQMRKVEDGSIDMVMTDPPHGITRHAWDIVIPFEPMWTHLKRVVRQDTAILLVGGEPYSSYLRISNINMYRYDWVINKKFSGNWASARKQPMKIHDIISVFYRKNRYYPQMTVRDKPIKGTTGSTNSRKGRMPIDPNQLPPREYHEKFPESILYFPRILGRSKDKVDHPSQKSVLLMEYMIKTYTREGDTVLDFAMGSGTTGVACKNLNREFVGIELDVDYFKIAKDRIESHMPQLRQAELL